ncbi:hypothetical protein BDV38DRAFT_277817 [Aspergillus pseudotamarii]|uniref:Uncharacterized protein n=1 Tax=Aspergillus pseudotamarii TaxID=132259 RepID=A0A5N6T9P9_ASPPS|nr:uncharacterized protein BDV38DRAFT_277817 [Aspergillus pseudotamarii]KAE8143010.1 hypothetical protein BDV38DRAFT_277817 [Aspergillus pseudotamarii]
MSPKPNPLTITLQLLTLLLILSIVGKRTTTLVLASVFTLWFKTRFTLYQDHVEERRSTRRERERQRRSQAVRVISARIVEEVIRGSGSRSAPVSGSGLENGNGDFGVCAGVNGGVGVGERSLAQEGLDKKCVEGSAGDGESEKGFGDLDGGVVVGVQVYEVGASGSLGEDEVSVGVGEVEVLEGEGDGEEKDGQRDTVEQKWEYDDAEGEVYKEHVGEEAIDEKVEVKVKVDVVEEKDDEGTSAQWIEDIAEDQEEKQVVQQDESQKIPELDEVKQEEPQREEQKPESTALQDEKHENATWADDEKQEKPVEEDKKATTETIPKASGTEPEKESKQPEAKQVEPKLAGLSQSRWSTSLSGSKKVLDPRASTFQPTEFKSSAKSQYQFSLPTTTRPQSSTPLAYSSIGILASSSSSSPLSAYSPPSIFSSVGRSTQSSTPSYGDYSHSPSYGYNYSATSSYGNTPSYASSSSYTNSSYANTSSYANNSPYGNTSSYGNSSYSCYTPSPYYSSYNYASAS